MVEFKKIIREEDAKTFSELSGDFNPLHIDKDFGKKSSFGGNIVQGMLLGSFFSALVGTHCPGEKCLYISQTLNFKKPVYFGDEILIRGTVLRKIGSTKMVVFRTDIIKGEEVVVDGEAIVKVLE